MIIQQVFFYIMNIFQSIIGLLQLHLSKRQIFKHYAATNRFLAVLIDIMEHTCSFS